MAHGLTPDEAVTRIADWKGKDIRWEELGGGITNHNYIVWVNGGWGNPGGGKYVLRVPGAGTDMFIDRDVERECMIEAARIGTAPQVAHVIEPEKAMVIDFIDGEVMHPDTMAGHPRAHQAGRRGSPRVPRQSRLSQQDRDLRHAAPLHEGRA